MISPQISTCSIRFGVFVPTSLQNGPCVVIWGDLLQRLQSEPNSVKEAAGAYVLLAQSGSLLTRQTLFNSNNKHTTQLGVNTSENDKLISSCTSRTSVKRIEALPRPYLKVLSSAIDYFLQQTRFQLRIYLDGNETLQKLIEFIPTPKKPFILR